MDCKNNLSGESSACQLQSRRRRGKRRESCRRFECLSPRALLSRWFSSDKELKGRRILKVERELRREGLDVEVGMEREAEAGCSMNGPKGESSSCILGLKGARGIADVSGQYSKEDCVNLALGFGLFYLIVTSKNEVNKIMELRTEMEMLLQNVKEKLQDRTRETLAKPSESNVISACSIFGVEESLCSNGCVSLQNQLLNATPIDSETPELCGHSLSCDTTRQNKCMEGIDQLEAELEAELERMQIHLDTGDLIEYTKQQNMEMTVEDAPPAHIQDPRLGEVFDSPEATIEHFGVPPDELRRRLHEILELRLEERIKELEAALECANGKLIEKERELAWWKDTAQLISQHVPNTSQ